MVQCSTLFTILDPWIQPKRLRTTVVFTTEKSIWPSTPMQHKTMLFKGQLYDQDFTLHYCRYSHWLRSKERTQYLITSLIINSPVYVITEHLFCLGGSQPSWQCTILKRLFSCYFIHLSFHLDSIQNSPPPKEYFKLPFASVTLTWGYESRWFSGLAVLKEHAYLSPFCVFQIWPSFQKLFLWQQFSHITSMLHHHF